MAEITAQSVNEFRKATGLGLMECKALLKEADGDTKKATTLAQEHGKANAAKRSGGAAGPAGSRSTSTTTASPAPSSRSTARPTSSPATRSSASSPRTWRSAGRRRNPVSVRRDEVNPAVPVEEQRRIFLKQAEDKPEPIRAKIAEGKLNSWFSESVLLDQVFVKDSAKTVREVIIDVNARVGENISVARFARFIVGESAPADAGEPEG